MEFSFKAEYAYDYGMPQWLARIDHALRGVHLERSFLDATSSAIIVSGIGTRWRTMCGNILWTSVVSHGHICGAALWRAMCRVI